MRLDLTPRAFPPRRDDRVRRRGERSDVRSGDDLSRVLLLLVQQVLISEWSIPRWLLLYL